MKKIAIIGAGISGLSTAFHLHNDYDLTVFEKQSYLGGHTDTHSLSIDGETVQIDSGFIIFCPEFYPNFNNMLDSLQVKSQPTDMSFSAFNPLTDTVYNATSLNKLFCQRRNLVRPRFLKMLADIVRFYSTSGEVITQHDTEKSVKQYLQEKRYGTGFIQDHLFPMISALWSATPERVEQFPIHHLVEFFRNHGLMKLINRPQWRVITGGSASYVDALQNNLNCKWVVDAQLLTVRRYSDHVEIVTANQTHTFDAVVFATHSDQALELIEQPNEHETDILSTIKFEKNHVVVHTDEQVMHPNKLSWASWNTQVPTPGNETALRCCTANYWMNLLQGLSTPTNVFTSLNPSQPMNSDKILLERYYSHPIFTASSVAAQKRKHLIDGQQRSYFTGAYWGWGFHEDGARSAVEVSKLIREQV